MDHHKLYSAVALSRDGDGWMTTKLLNCLYIAKTYCCNISFIL